jgi:hypothetical protein
MGASHAGQLLQRVKKSRKVKMAGMTKRRKPGTRRKNLEVN